MIKSYHNFNFQLEVIRQKYIKMETELREKRQKRKEDIAEFMEENVLVKWTELRNQRRKMETRVKHSHEVCLKHN